MKTATQENGAARPHDVFISYSRKDKEFVRRLDEALTARGRQAWVDWEGIRPTEEFMQAIYRAIEGADTFVFVLTPDSVASEVCGREVAHAAALNKRMIPIVARDVDAKAVPDPLAKLNWIFCRESDDFEAAVTLLVSALDTDLEWIRDHTRLLTRALEWETNKKSRSFVLRGEDLRSAEQWLAQAGADKERQPTALQTEYIIASRKAAAKLQRLITGAIGVGLIVSIGLTILAWTQRQQAVTQRDATQHVLSLSDLSKAQELIASGEAPSALAFLARAVGNYPKGSGVASDRLWFALTQRAWPLPLSAPMRHKAAIIAATFSPDEQRVLTASRDFSAQLWDAATGRAVGEPIKHPAVVRCAAFSPDGKQVVTGCDDAKVRLWSIDQGKCNLRWTGEHENSISAVAFSHGGSYIATGSQDHALSVWEVSTGKRVFNVFGTENVHTVSFHPADERLLLSGSGMAGQLWNVPEQRKLFALSHQEQINSARFNSTGEKIITSSDDGTARIWNSATGELIGEPLKHDGVVEDAIFSPNDQLIATVAGDAVYLFQGAERRLIQHGKRVKCARFSRDSARLITGTEDGRLQSWSVFNGEPIGEPVRDEDAIVSVDPASDERRLLVVSANNAARVWRAPAACPASDMFRHHEAIETMAASADGRLLLTAGGDGKATLWDVAKRSAAAILDHGAGVLCAGFSPDGKYVATGGVNEQVRVWRTDSGEAVGAPLSNDGMIHRIQFSPDSQSLVAATETGSARIWSLPDLHPLGEPMTHGEKITGIAFSPDGTRILTTSWDKTAKLWDSKTGRNTATLAQGERELECGTFSPNASCIATGAHDGSVQLWTLGGERIRDPLWHKDEISALSFSPDGKRLATASADGMVVIWNPDTGQSVSEIWQNSSRITALLFSPDGSRIATGADDGRARLWDVETGEPVSEWLSHTESIRGLFFQNSGRVFCSVSSDKTIRIWDIATPSSPVERQALAGFALTMSNARLQSSSRVEWHALGTIEELRAQAHQFEVGSVAVLTKWWFADVAKRPLTPFATTDVPQYVAARIAEGTPESLREATLLAEGEPALQTAIARASSR